jgi:hypothetical protein
VVGDGRALDVDVDVYVDVDVASSCIVLDVDAVGLDGDLDGECR